MQEQTAILIQEGCDWIFVADDDAPERMWKDFNAAMKTLGQEGWQIVQGPAPIRPCYESDALDRFRPWGYRLRRGIQ